MKSFKPLKLETGEYIIAVVPQYASGPGWSNRPLWVYIGRNEGTFRQECIQPEEQTPEMHTLFKAGAAICESLKGCVPIMKARA